MTRTRLAVDDWTNMTEAADLSTQDFTALADLASARVGGRAVATSDDFFAPMSP